MILYAVDDTVSQENIPVVDLLMSGLVVSDTVPMPLMTPWALPLY